MNHDARADPPRLEAHRLADGMRYELPRRPLGPLRWLGLVPVGFGLLFVMVPANMARGLIGDLLGDGGPERFLGLIFVAFVSLFIFAGLVPIALGLAVMFGRNAVVVRDGVVRCIERVGPFWRTRKPRLEGVTRLEVVSAVGKGIGSEAADAETGNPKRDLAGLRAHGSGDDNLLLAWGYPSALMHELADAIAQDALPHRPARLFDDAADEPGIEIVERTVDLSTGKLDEPDPDTFHVPQPAGSQITLDPGPDGITITVPPAGLLKGSKGLFAFALCWNWSWPCSPRSAR